MKLNDPVNEIIKKHVADKIALSQSVGNIPKVPSTKKAHRKTSRKTSAKKKNNSDEEDVDITFSSDEDPKTVKNPFSSQGGKNNNSISIPSTSGVNKSNPRNLSHRSMISNRGVSQEKFKTESRIRELREKMSPYQNRVFLDSEIMDSYRSVESQKEKLHTQESETTQARLAKVAEK